MQTSDAHVGGLSNQSTSIRGHLYRLGLKSGSERFKPSSQKEVEIWPLVPSDTNLQISDTVAASFPSSEASVLASVS